MPQKPAAEKKKEKNPTGESSVTHPRSWVLKKEDITPPYVVPRERGGSVRIRPESRNKREGVIRRGGKSRLDPKRVKRKDYERPNLKATIHTRPCTLLVQRYERKTKQGAKLTEHSKS